MATYATITNLDPSVIKTDQDESALCAENIENALEKEANAFVNFFEENDNVLISLTSDLKSYWEYLGLLTFVTYSDIIKVFEKTLVVKNIPAEILLEYEDFSEYETDDEKNMFL